MSAAKKAGVIYILTNPSFPDYVKIGYATNIENRLKQLTGANVSRLRFGYMLLMMFRLRYKIRNCIA